MRAAGLTSSASQSSRGPELSSRIVFAGQPNQQGNSPAKALKQSTSSSNFKVWRSEGRLTGTGDLQGVVGSSTLPTEGSANLLPPPRSRVKRDTRVPKKVPLTAAQILEQENLKLVNPSMVLLKHLRINSEESTQFRMKLIENVLEAKQQLGERVVDPHVKKNIGLINDFYLKLKQKVKVKKAQQDLIRSTSRLSDHKEGTHDSQSAGEGPYKTVGQDKSLEGLHILSQEELDNPQSVPLDEKLATRLEHIAEVIQKRNQNSLGVASRALRASVSSARQSQQSGLPGRKKSVFGSKHESEAQARAARDQAEIDATPRANQIAQKLKGEDKFLMEVNFLIRMIRESKKEASSGQTQAQKANYLAILERIKSMRGKPEPVSSQVAFETLCDSPLKKLKSNLESEKLHAKLQELQTQKQTARNQKKAQKVTRLSALVAAVRQKAKHPLQYQSGLRLAELFDDPKGLKQNGPLLTTLAGQAKRELAKHLLLVEPKLVEEISPRDPHRLIFEPVRRIHDPFVETLRDEYFRQKDMCYSEDWQTLQLKRQQLSMPTSDFCGKSSDTVKSLAQAAHPFEKSRPKKEFRINGRLASLPSLTKRSLNNPNFEQMGSDDSNNASNMSGDQELNTLFRELREVVPIRNSLQDNYRNEHRGLQATLESKIKELNDQVIKRLIKTTK